MILILIYDVGHCVFMILNFPSQTLPRKAKFYRVQ